MSMVPMTGNKPSFNPAVFFKDENVGIAYGMGMTAEKVAQQWKVSREDQDAFALASHQRALAAIAAGEFSDEITPVDVVDRVPDLATGGVLEKRRTVSIDEGPRADTSVEGLAKLRAVFAARGSVTAGNSSQTSDGAGALILASEKAIKQYGLTPLARIVSAGHSGVDPAYMGIGPVPASRRALDKAGLKVGDMDVIESNEAFAAQACAVAKDLGFDPEKVNPNGSGIGLGHPVGATGAILTVKAMYEMARTGGRHALVTMCIGGGQGIAAVLERV
jgi:acetyl-CoA acyltransferase